ncbi:raffinose/stachyose/melibiose transport system substrate-binding protein [Paenibacillus uliginis N3/975]|uniref:Raffinose/stachyose/melibiose transport system substrate-binding protein n=1 Tax=Paenibacillus uliginis N3/975 TaxID=1313296 RepID=A0A1X7HKZ4_9BACL|nr:extracellular solute-binding protein [Paenibacillus uliginis]SMF87714.1 raffinose/stachyose/melibiose transport system substrate-binding protein [Paenibacillus uliginis N3/975]
MKKKSLALLMSLLLVTSAFVSGCGADKEPAKGSEGTPEAGNEPFEMTIRHTQVGDSKKFRLALLQDVVKKTEAAVPGLKLNLDGVDSEVNRKEKLRGEMASGKPPEIFDVFGSPDAGVYAKEGLMLDITPIVDELGIKDKFTTLDPFTHDGKLYGLPIGGNIEGFFYNKEYFEQKGLSVPKTLAELEKIAETIKADGKIPFAQSSKDAWIPLMTTNNLWAYYAGPEITYGFKTGESKWTDPKVVEGVKKHQEWVQKGYYKKGELGFEYADMRNQIISGEAIMMMDGSWATSVFRDPEQAGDMVGKIGFFNLPPVNEGDPVVVMQDANNGYGFSASIKDDPRKMQAVKELIKNMWTDEMQLRGLKEDGVLPAMKMDVATMNSTSDDAIMQDIFKAVSEIDKSFPAFDALVQASVNTALSLGIQQVIGGEIDAEQMLKNVQAAQDAANESEGE